METLLNPAEAAVLVAQLRARVIVSMTACRASDRCSSCFDVTPAGGNVRLAPPRLSAGGLAQDEAEPASSRVGTSSNRLLESRWE